MQTEEKLKTDNSPAGKVSSLLTGYVPVAQKKYYEWIKENYPNKTDAYMQCHEAALKMVFAFPELTAVPGHVYVGLNYRPHWWCVTTDDEIIDPSAHQWDSPILQYDPWTTEEPIGKCLNCGEYA